MERSCRRRRRSRARGGGGVVPVGDPLGGLPGLAAVRPGRRAAADRAGRRRRRPVRGTPGTVWPGAAPNGVCLRSSSGPSWCRGCGDGGVLNLDTSVAFLTPVLVYTARSRGEGEAPLLYGCLLLSNAGSLFLPGSNLDQPDRDRSPPPDSVASSWPTPGRRRSPPRSMAATVVAAAERRALSAGVEDPTPADRPVLGLSGSPRRLGGGGARRRTAQPSPPGCGDWCYGDGYPLRHRGGAAKAGGGCSKDLRIIHR